MKVFLFTRRSFVSLAVGLLAGVLLLCVSVTGVSNARETAGSQRKIPIYCVDREEKVASLSFDAAWGNEDTEELIEILARYNVRVTFFVVGDWVEKYPESVKALSEAGHEIQNHSDSHPHLTQLSREQMMGEIRACNEKIQAITGVCPTLLRAPYGDYNNTVVEVMKEMGLYTIHWDVDSLDWKGLSGQEIYQRVTSRVKNGSIVLFHHAAEHTPEALGDIIAKLQKDGFSLVPISELIHEGVYFGDHEGRQHAGGV